MPCKSSKNNKNCRLDWANLMINFPFTDYITFSDKFSFWLFDNDLKEWFHSPLLSIYNHSEKIQVCAGIS